MSSCPSGGGEGKNGDGDEITATVTMPVYGKVVVVKRPLEWSSPFKHVMCGFAYTKWGYIWPDSDILRALSLVAVHGSG